MEKSELKDKIQLTNDGRLQLFFVGTGSAFNKVNFQTNLLVIKGKDHLLIDCGTICPYALSTYNTPISQIQNVLPTHSHADDTGGLDEMADDKVIERQRKSKHQSGNHARHNQRKLHFEKAS